MKAMQANADAPVVATSSGKVRGYFEAGLAIFKGIPYGAVPPENRFMAPHAPTPWSDIREATKYGPLAPQPIFTEGMFGASDAQTLLQGSARWFDTTFSEDCLTLSVWGKSPVSPGERGRPVMVHCHGGGFSGGSSGTDWTDGANLARKNDVVVVAMNHRLNIFGHLHLDEVGGPKYRGSGNAGLLDLVAALTWVRDNAAHFGGDPDNVTIFGESGGGAKVAALMAMPSANGLFHKAIIQAGPFIKAIPAAEAARTTRMVMEHLGVRPDGVEELQAMPREKLLLAMNAVMVADGLSIGMWRNGTPFHMFAPVVDGAVLPRHPFDPDAPEISAGIPLIIGCASDEGRMFGWGDPGVFDLDEAELRSRLKVHGIEGAVCDATLQAYRTTRPNASFSDLFFAIISDMTFRMDAIIKAERKAAQQSAPVYMYLFTWQTAAFGGKYRAQHGIDLSFAFDTIDAAPGLMTPDSRHYTLAENMSKAWAAFARTGNPNHAGLPDWQPYTAKDRATMVFDFECALVNDPRREDRLAALPLAIAQVG